MIATDTKLRCPWVGLKPHLIRYHDEEWGVPVHDDRKHFEMLLLEGAQASRHGRRFCGVVKDTAKPLSDLILL